MAIKFIEEQASGVVGEYWRVSCLQIDSKRTTATVQLYKDKAARDAGKEPIKTVNHSWTLANNPFSADVLPGIIVNPFVTVYNKLKNSPEFTGSEDV